MRGGAGRGGEVRGGAGRCEENLARQKLIRFSIATSATAPRGSAYTAKICDLGDRGQALERRHNLPGGEGAPHGAQEVAVSTRVGVMERRDGRMSCCAPEAY